MTYATRDDLVQAYGEIAVTRLSSGRAEDPTGASTVAGALTYAAGVIDARLSARFALPLPQIPVVLRDVAVDLALSRMATSADGMTDEYRRREARALADLRAIAEGHMNLGLPARGPADTGRPVIAPGSPVVGLSGVSKLFSRGSLRGL